jgi:uncharacterized protein YndB with AHSA1/START domain
MSSTDRIEKQIQLKAPRARVWKAITDPKEFGEWFRVGLEGKFEVGKAISGKILYPGYEHLTMTVVVDRMDAEHVFAYRWHPNATDPNVDYSPDPMTLVEFRLEEKDGGTLLTLTESGFDKLPAARRDAAYRGNEGGWAEQLTNIERHVSR